MNINYMLYDVPDDLVARPEHSKWWGRLAVGTVTFNIIAFIVMLSASTFVVISSGTATSPAPAGLTERANGDFTE